MRHFIWVFTVCQSTRLGVSSLQRVNRVYCFYFQIDSGVDVNLLMFIPTAVIGIIGGLLGALFTILNLKMTRLRKKLLSSIGREWIQKLIRLFEPALIMVKLLFC